METFVYKQFLVAKDKFTGEQRTFTFEGSPFGEMLVVEETTSRLVLRSFLSRYYNQEYKTLF